jgi:CHAT domain-containing protein
VLEEALAMRRTLIGEDMYVARGLTSLAEIRAATGETAAAESLLEDAAHVYDTARLRAASGLERADYSRYSPYPQLAAARLASGMQERAWPAAEKALAISLADVLRGADGRHLTFRETAVEDSLEMLLSDLERQVDTFLRAAADDTAGDSAEMAEDARLRLLAAQVEWTRFQETIAGRHPVTEGVAASLADVQDALSPRSAIVGWLDVRDVSGQECSWGYVVRAAGPVEWIDLTATADAAADARRRSGAFRGALSSPAGALAGVHRDGVALWTERVAPLIPLLDGVEDLVVIPSGAMVGIPVEALLDPAGVFLGDRFSMSYAPSATIHAWLAGVGAGEAEPSRALVVGDPPFSPVHLEAMVAEGAGESIQLAEIDIPVATALLRSALSGNDEALAALPRLAGTRREAAAIAAVAGDPTLLIGPDASEQELVRAAESGRLSSYSTIHVATHALVDDRYPERSALVLSQVGLPDPVHAAERGERIYDGLLTAKEIVREWDLDADLVTLSACETGLGKEVVGEGYIGFAHAFLQAGARSLVVSLWKVEDEATSLLMRRFYENRFGRYGDTRDGLTGEPMSKAAALREAKQWLREHTDEQGRRPYEHPYYWSAFILIGDPS